MIIVQCDTVISLVDEEYYDRAWCTVEVMMVQTLINSYKLHSWYEDRPVEPDENHEGGGGKHALRPGPVHIQLDPVAKKDCSKESDRPRLQFLERQSKLLGKG